MLRQLGFRGYLSVLSRAIGPWRALSRS